MEGDCGAANPLMQWTSHFAQEKSMLKVREGGSQGKYVSTSALSLSRLDWTMTDWQISL